MFPQGNGEEDDDDEAADETLVKVDDDEVQKKKRIDKKRRLKERFDAEYDDGDATYFDDLKEEMHKQAEVRDSAQACCYDESSESQVILYLVCIDVNFGLCSCFHVH